MSVDGSCFCPTIICKECEGKECEGKEMNVKGSVWKGKNVKELKCRKGNECERNCRKRMEIMWMNERKGWEGRECKGKCRDLKECEGKKWTVLNLHIHCN